MSPSAGQATKRQAASMMMVAEPKLTLHFADVQMQPGGSDCGVFALTFTTAICFGHSPGKFQFDQQPSLPGEAAIYNVPSKKRTSAS